MQAVREVLADIGASDKAGVVVFNKADALDEGQRAVLSKRYPEAVFVSALTGEGADALVGRIGDEAARGSITLTALVPYTRGELVQVAHERAQIISERHTESGTQLTLRASAEVAAAFREFEVSAEGG